MKNILLTLLISITGATLYRMGGSDKWNTKWRDLGVPACILALFIVWNGVVWNFWYLYLASFLMTFGSLTTYWKKKGTDAKWYHWLFVGLGISIAALPLAIISGDWIGFIIRTIVCSGLICVWSVLISNAVVEELGRGFIAVITVILIGIFSKKNRR